MRRLISEICFFLADVFYGLAEFAMLIARKVRKKVLGLGVPILMSLSACAQAPQLPKGFFCWPDKGYIVCQFVPNQEESKTSQETR